MIKEISFCPFGFKELFLNINVFFFFVFNSLMMIFFLFKPLAIKQQDFVDVPLFELNAFTMHELNAVGLQTFMLGDSATRYSDRYTVSNMDYTDNSKKQLANMRADNGVYKGDNVSMLGNVTYSREDGLTFESQELTYDKETLIAKATTDYTAYRGKNTLTGNSMEYDGLSKKIKSTDVVMTYQLKESKL